MKRIIAINLLILLVHFPYVALRWIDLPYTSPDFYLEEVMGFGAMLTGPMLFVNTILLLVFHFRSFSWKYKSLIFNVFLLTIQLLFSWYVALMITIDGRVVWIDVLAFSFLYIAFRWHRLELEKCIS